MTNERLRDAAQAAQLVTAVIAIVALWLAILGAGAVTTSRRDAARDTCQLLRGLVYASTRHAPAQRTAANAYIHSTPLRNCTLYADDLIK